MSLCCLLVLDSNNSTQRLLTVCPVHTINCIIIVLAFHCGTLHIFALSHLECEVAHSALFGNIYPLLEECELGLLLHLLRGDSGVPIVIRCFHEVATLLSSKCNLMILLTHIIRRQLLISRHSLVAVVVVCVVVAGHLGWNYLARLLRMIVLCFILLVKFIRSYVNIRPIIHVCSYFLNILCNFLIWHLGYLFTNLCLF